MPVTRPAAAIDLINLYVLANRLKALPEAGGLMDQDPEILRAFIILHNAEKEGST